MTGSDIDQKEKVRRQIVDNFFEIDNPSKENQEILKKYLDDMLYLPDIIEHSKFVFKTSVQTEMQGEDEIVFQDEGYKRPSFATRASSDGLTNRVSTELGEANKNEAQDVTLTQIESTQSNVFVEKKPDIFN